MFICLKNQRESSHAVPSKHALASRLPLFYAAGADLKKSIRLLASAFCQRESCITLRPVRCLSFWADLAPGHRDERRDPNARISVSVAMAAW